MGRSRGSFGGFCRVYIHAYMYSLEMQSVFIAYSKHAAPVAGQLNECTFCGFFTANAIIAYPIQVSQSCQHELFRAGLLESLCIPHNTHNISPVTKVILHYRTPISTLILLIFTSVQASDGISLPSPWKGVVGLRSF